MADLEGFVTYAQAIEAAEHAGTFELTPEASARNLLAEAVRLRLDATAALRRARGAQGLCPGCGFGEDVTCQCHERGER